MVNLFSDTQTVWTALQHVWFFTVAVEYEVANQTYYKR